MKMICKSAIFILLVLTAAGSAFAQSNAADASARSSSERKSDDGSPSERLLETQYRWRMRAEEKEFNEMLERSGDALRLSETLKTSFAQSNSFSAADAAKLNQLEKQIKKVRRSLGGDDDDDAVSETKPTSIADALDKIIEIGTTLNQDLKKRTRYEINAASIDNANEMLELIIFIRTFSRP